MFLKDVLEKTAAYDLDGAVSDNLFSTSINGVAKVLRLLVQFNNLRDESFESVSTIFSTLFQHKNCFGDSELEDIMDEIASSFLTRFKASLVSNKPFSISHLSYQFLDTIIESHGNLYSDFLPPGHRELRAHYYMESFIEIIFSVGFQYNPEVLYAPASDEMDFSAIDNSYYLLAKLSEYAMIIMDAVPIESLVGPLIALTDHCVNMFEKIPRSRYMFLLESSPVARSVAAYVCKHVAFLPESALLSPKASTDALGLLITCAHVDNCSSCLHLALRVYADICHYTSY
jgi:hypothetical protein